jgi:Terminase large subunit, T4likevirus-type, N-terminal
MRTAGFSPDPWQEQLLRTSADRRLLLAGRQTGKSTLAAAMALQVALLEANAIVLLLSPSLRQSGELFRKVTELFHRLGRPVPAKAENALQLELVDRARIVSLPGEEATVRGFSGVSLLLIDEAARVADPWYFAVRPMLAVSRGRLVALSTPFGKRGWFSEEWHGNGAGERIHITAEECPRISAEFLREEQQAMGERWYRQEYLCSFEDAVGAVFRTEEIEQALCSDLECLERD